MPYTPTTWSTGNSVTAALLNNIEQGIATVASGIINVKEPAYGAKGDGVTNDTAAVQAAIDAASALTIGGTIYGGAVYFPPGAYVLGTINLKTNVYLIGGLPLAAQGNHRHQARLIPSGIADNGFMITQAGGTITNVGVIGFSSFGDGATSKTGFMSFTDVQAGTFAGLYIMNYGIEAVKLVSPSGNCRFSYSFFAGLTNRAYIAAQAGSFTLGGADHQVSNCELTGPDQNTVSSANLYCAAAKIDCGESLISDTVFQIGDVGLVTSASTIRNRFVGCRFDTNAGHGMLITNGADFTFTGCSWVRNSFAANNTYDHINVPSTGGSRMRVVAPMFHNNGHTVRYWINDQKNNDPFHSWYFAPEGDDAGTANWSLSGGANPSFISGVDPVTKKVVPLPAQPLTRAPDILKRTGAIAETYSRRGVPVTNLATLTSGQMIFVGIALCAGQVISQIVFQSATTALVSGNNQWFGLWDSAGNQLRLTADDTTTAWAANTEKTLTLSSTYTVTADGVFYLSCMVNATTVPSVFGISAGSPAVQAPRLCAIDTAHTGLTNPASAPAAATFANTSSYLWAYVK